MKRRNILNFTLAGSAITFMVFGASLAFAKGFDGLFKAEAEINTHSSSSITTIELKDNTDQEIVQYYSDLNGLPSSQLQGTNLLKNLKGILNKGVIYHSYSDVERVFVVTERNWKVSPTLNGTYSSDGMKVTGFSHTKEIEKDPELHLLYVDYDVRSSTKYKDKGDFSPTQRIFDQEHVWSQSHGFDNGQDDGDNLTGAGSDLHHLMAGAQTGNRYLHNNYSYGFVGTSSFTDDKKAQYTYSTKNDFGTPLFSHAQDETPANVFEPQDSDKGDIARALLYMVACYNNYDGSTPTPNNPALELVNYLVSENTTGYSSDNLEYGKYGMLQDILAWHRMDPVDEYEIHRNNLIYNNYQKNRNPFIDYPQWVDFIWGTSEYNPTNKTINYNSTPTGYANLLKDKINGYRDPSDANLVSIEVTTPQTKNIYRIGDKFDPTGLVVTGHYDDSTTADVTLYCGYNFDTTTLGVNKTVAITCGDISTTTTASVYPPATVSSITLNETELEVDMADGLSLTLVPTITGTNYPEQKAIWSSSNEKVATVVDGTVYLNRLGSVVITAAAFDDTSKTATCSITIADSRPSGSSETTTIGLSDYTIAPNEPAGTTNTIVKSVFSENDLTLTYAGVNTNAATGNKEPYTSYRMYVQNNGYIYSENAIEGFYPSRIEVHFSGTTADSANIVTSFTETKNDVRSTSGTDHPVKSGSYIASNIDDSKAFWNFSTNGSNVQVTSIDVTYTSLGGTGGDISATGVSVNPSSLSLELDATYTLEAIVAPADATNDAVTWTSSDSTIAIVDDFGLVLAKSVGSTTITVTTEDGGFTSTCSLTVIAKDLSKTQSVVITIDSFLAHTGLGTNDEWLDTKCSGMGDIANFNSYIGLSNGTGAKLPIHNTEKLRGYITNITIVANTKMDTSKNLNLYYSSNAISFSGNTPEGLDADQQALVCDSDISINLSKGMHYSYFAIKPMGTSIYIDSITITYDASEYVASNWSKGFFNAMNGVCDSIHGNTNLSSLTSAWNEQATAFNALDTDVKALISNPSNIYDSEYRADVETAVSSYTYIASKYSSLNAFITGVSLSQTVNGTSLLDTSNKTFIVIVILSTIALFSFGEYMIIRKKKFD